MMEEEVQEQEQEREQREGRADTHRTQMGRGQQTHMIKSVEKALIVHEEVCDRVHDLMHLDSLLLVVAEDHKELAVHAGLPLELLLHIAHVLRRAAR